MRNYIILNGVNSNTITGLLISTLPPITKPKIRTQVEEIDGRDGDIVTKLGYSAYEKEFQIGLYGDFNIDEVIAYFNSEGTVVFSNEEDKYYNYQILDQIDFEKLIKFKTANIKMHVQPFKYPTEEEQIQVDATVVTGSGSNITLEYTSLGNIITSEVDGDTQQDGTPTPDSPIAVQTVTGNQSITICGKNLWGGFNSDYSRSHYGINYINKADGSITANGTSTQESYSLNSTQAQNNGRIITLEAGTYTLSGGTEKCRLQLADTDAGTIIANTTSTSFNVTFTLTSNKNCFIRAYVPANNTVNNITIYPMLEKGSTASDYYPYQSQTYPITLGSTELCKIGDYQEKIYQNEGTWYIDKKIGKVVLNGTEEGWSNDTSGKLSGLTISDIKVYSSASAIIEGYCNYYQNGSLTSSRTNTNEYSSYSGKLYFNNQNMTLANFKTWLSTHNIIVYYLLSTPTTTEITDTDLLAELNALAGATTYDNQTNIVVSGTMPASLSVSTQGMPNTVINNIGNIYAKPLITIYGSGNIGVYLNYIQVLQIALGDNESITIDVSKMEAYDKNTQVLMNRLVTGDYMKFLINSGDNNIAFSGNVLGFTMDNYTRWL